jgi:hypothetical protein
MPRNESTELGDQMRTVTLSIDVRRHNKLKHTADVTRLSMSEITRIALDALWDNIGDINALTPRALLNLDYSNSQSRTTRKTQSQGKKQGQKRAQKTGKERSFYEPEQRLVMKLFSKGAGSALPRKPTGVVQPETEESTSGKRGGKGKG